MKINKLVVFIMRIDSVILLPHTCNIYDWRNTIQEQHTYEK